MKFYIPDIEEPEGLYEGVKRFLESQGFNVESHRYRWLAYNHNGKKYKDTVGSQNIGVNEKILLILKAGSMFLICTVNRGVLRGEPILVGLHEISEFEMFE